MIRICRKGSLALLAGGATLWQLGCGSQFFNELDLFTSPQALNSLFFVPRSNFFNGFLEFWRLFDLL
jgi:hypothetical protein